MRPEKTGGGPAGKLYGPIRAVGTVWWEIDTKRGDCRSQVGSDGGLACTDRPINLLSQPFVSAA